KGVSRVTPSSVRDEPLTLSVMDSEADDADADTLMFDVYQYQAAAILRTVQLEVVAQDIKQGRVTRHAFERTR
ncbi:hypothetical protein, partial [Caballeronia sp. M23-90]